MNLPKTLKIILSALSSCHCVGLGHHDLCLLAHRSSGAICDTASARIGTRRVSTSSAVIWYMSDRTAMLSSSRLATLRWRRHAAPSTLKMPPPRRSPRMVAKGLPLGKLSKLVLRMYSTLSGLAVTTQPSTWTWTVSVGDARRRCAYQSPRLAVTTAAGARAGARRRAPPRRKPRQRTLFPCTVLPMSTPWRPSLCLCLSNISQGRV
jgi:hypothetical protein